MLGNRSDTMPLNSFKSSIRNLGTLTSWIARKAISSWNIGYVQVSLCHTPKKPAQSIWFSHYRPHSCLDFASSSFLRPRLRSLQLSYQSHNGPENKKKFSKIHSDLRNWQFWIIVFFFSPVSSAVQKTTWMLSRSSWIRLWRPRNRTRRVRSQRWGRSRVPS